jgi:hypothetical protein
MGGVLTDISRDLRPPVGSGPRRPQNESNPSQLRDKDQPEDDSDPGLVAPVLAQSYCDGLYPICCPANAWGMDQCCWDSAYPWGNPGWLPECRGRIDGDGGGGGGGGEGTKAVVEVARTAERLIHLSRAVTTRSEPGRVSISAKAMQTAIRKAFKRAAVGTVGCPTATLYQWWLGSIELIHSCTANA